MSVNSEVTKHSFNSTANQMLINSNLIKGQSILKKAQKKPKIVKFKSFMNETKVETTRYLNKELEMLINPEKYQLSKNRFPFGLNDNITKALVKAVSNITLPDEQNDEDFKAYRLRITASKLDSTSVRQIYIFKSIEDSVSDFEEGDYYDYVLKWYSIDPESYFSTVVSITYQVSLIFSLFFYPIELLHLYSLNVTLILIHNFLEFAFILNYILNLLQGFTSTGKVNNGPNYSISAHFLYKYENASILLTYLELLHIVFGYFTTYCLAQIFSCANETLLQVIQVNIMTKFFKIVYIIDWIDMNSILKFSNSISFYFDQNSNKAKKNPNTKDWSSLLSAVTAIKIFLYYFIILHTFACVWLFLFVKGQHFNNHNNWGYAYGINVNDSTSQYLSSFYFCLVTLLSVGYGDIVPTNFEERLFVSIYMIVGCFFYSLLITLISFMFSKKESKETLLTEKIKTLKIIQKEYLLREDFCKKLHAAVQHYSLDWKIDKMALIENLPRNLKIELQHYIFRKVRSSLNYFNEVNNEQFIFNVCSQLKSHIYEKNALLLQVGDSFQEIYFVKKGALLIYLGETHENYPISKVSVQNVFGDHYISKRSPSKYTLKTETKSNEILTLSYESYKRIEETYADEFEQCKSKTSFNVRMLDELRLGANIYFDVHGTLKSYREFSMNLINIQINSELGNGMNFNYLLDVKEQYCLAKKKVKTLRFSDMLISNTQTVDDKFRKKASKLKSIKLLISHKAKSIIKLKASELVKKRFYENVERQNTSKSTRKRTLINSINGNNLDFRSNAVKKNYNEDIQVLIYYNNLDSNKISSDKFNRSNINFNKGLNKLNCLKEILHRSKSKQENKHDNNISNDNKTMSNKAEPEMLDKITTSEQRMNKHRGRASISYLNNDAFRFKSKNVKKHNQIKGIKDFLKKLVYSSNFNDSPRRKKVNRNHVRKKTNSRLIDPIPFKFEYLNIKKKKDSCQPIEFCTESIKEELEESLT